MITAPFICGKTETVFNTWRVAGSTQIVVFSAPPSAEVTSSFRLSKVPVGTVTFSALPTLTWKSFAFCAWTSKLR